MVNIKTRIGKNNVVLVICSIAILAVILCVVIGCAPQKNTYVPIQPRDDEVLKTIDKNKDGKIDIWVYGTKSGIPRSWIRDKNYDGIPDNWSFFKDGKAFIDEVDFDGDGKVDTIYINIWNENKTKTRGLSFRLRDKDRNVFVEQEDTGWVEINNK